MGIWGWILLLAASAALATAAQYLIFGRDRDPEDVDWVYVAAGGLVGGFTGHAWYPGAGPMVDGLNVLPAMAGLVVGAVVLEVIYRQILRTHAH